LNKSKYYLIKNKKVTLENSERFTNQLLRLPLYPDLKNKEILFIIKNINLFFKMDLFSKNTNY
jgi:dTDP-4-amino-4,6-dideoxygalactose transaminase